MAKKAQSKKASTKRAPARKPSGEQKEKEPAQEAGTKTAETKSRFDEAMATVAAGASKGMERVSEEAPKVAAKTSEVAKEGYGKLKRGLSVAYREAKEQAERFKHTMEMRKLKARRKDLCADLGKAAYSQIVARGMAATDAFSEDRFVHLIEKIRRVDDEIVEVAKELEER